MLLKVSFNFSSLAINTGSPNPLFLKATAAFKVSGSSPSANTTLLFLFFILELIALIKFID